MFKDLEFKGKVKRGDIGKQVTLIQELLCLNNVNVVIDGLFGPATEQAIRMYQKAYGIAADGIVGKDTFERLTFQIKSALEPLEPISLPEMVVAYARQHLRFHPREVGGQNRGPWVRLYMDGKQGIDWPWCAGFVSFILKQACNSLSIPMPIKPTPSCYMMGMDAIDKKIFLPETKVKDFERERLTGCIFLVQKGGSWGHTGIVTAAEDHVIHTIEGNTNDSGSREGYEVCRRIRSYDNKDFILL